MIDSRTHFYFVEDYLEPLPQETIDTAYMFDIHVPPIDRKYLLIAVTKDKALVIKDRHGTFPDDMHNVPFDIQLLGKDLLKQMLAQKLDELVV